MATIDRATEYAESVVSGKVVAGKPHILACKRHLRDIERQGTKDFPYIWKPEMSDRIIRYGETLTIAEGTAPRQVRLFPFQCFDLGVPFGWYKPSGSRRFRRSYRCMARQNGKTFLNGIQGSYIAAFSGYRYGKCFTVATKHAQARLAWEEISKFIQADRELAAVFNIKDYVSLITARNTLTTIEALSRERSLDEGFRAIYASIDELHQHRDNSTYKALYNGTRSLLETLISMITTRGRSMNSFCFDMDAYCLNVLNGSAIAEDLFVDIHTLDPGDDPFDEKNWIKANPLLCLSEHGMDTMRTDAQTAKDMGGDELVDFMVKCLNTWPFNTDSQYIDVEKWNASACNLSLEHMKGRTCDVGLDLSSGGDLTSLALDFDITDMADNLPIVIPPSESNVDISYLYSHSFMPRGRLDEHIKTDIAPYDEWANEGLITITGGMSDYKNDYKFIIKHLREIRDVYDLRFRVIAYDPHNADGILADLEEFGCPLLQVTQSARYLNDATEDLRLGIKSARVLHERKNALLTWSFVNAKTVKNSFGEVKIDKEPRAKFKRVDPVDACIDARTARMKMPDEVNYDEEMQKYIERMGWV